ncbi:hypothetical protein ACKAV7_011493 [Fusarium commune]
MSRKRQRLSPDYLRHGLPASISTALARHGYHSTSGINKNGASLQSASSPSLSDTRPRKKPITTVDWRAELCRVLDQHDGISNADLLDELDSAFEELKESRSRQHVQDNCLHGPPRHQVLYRIRCEGSRLNHDDSEDSESTTDEGYTTFEKPPWVVEYGPHKAHSRGGSHISSLDLYLERNKDIAFLVYVDFACCGEDLTEKRYPQSDDSQLSMIRAASWSYDGTFKEIEDVLSITSPDLTHELKIESLSYYPQQFASADLSQLLLDRGKMFWQCRKRKYVSTSEIGGDGLQNSLDSRFMIDMETYNGPGTGKTLTAESVAEIAKRPLYRVTCGDIGTKAEDVEKFRSELNAHAITVVLLDEADVFLEQRSLVNLERNALVSVFLRVLEYYDGILILTSNRVGIFDEAFRSRIQLSLRYKNLGQAERYQIWENFLKHLDQFQQTVQSGPKSQSQQVPLIGYGMDISDLRKHLSELSQVELNGREIRNALSIARQLALYRKEALQFHHLKDVMNEAKKFDDYLNELNDGFSADAICRDRRER